MLLDTPEFDNTMRSDTEVLEMIAEFLKKLPSVDIMGSRF
jgi:hypothetical protein